MSKLNERLTLVTNVSVIAGIVFLAVEMRQNTEAIEAQTRDGITEKQMTYLGWIATSRDLAGVHVRGESGLIELDETERRMYSLLVNGMLREWENSLYQYERGLFTPEEFEPRMERWRLSMAFPGFREVWAGTRETFAPGFRAEIDRIVAEVGN